MAMIPVWAGGYVGIPFVDLGRDRDGCDCWGLVRLILAERAGLMLPCWATAYESEANRKCVLGLAEEQKSDGPRLPLPGELSAALVHNLMYATPASPSARPA